MKLYLLIFSGYFIFSALIFARALLFQAGRSDENQWFMKLLPPPVSGLTKSKDINSDTPRQKAA